MFASGDVSRERLKGGRAFCSFARTDGEGDVTRSAVTKKPNVIPNDDDVRRRLRRRRLRARRRGDIFPLGARLKRRETMRLVRRESLPRNAVWEKRPREENKEDAAGTRRGARRRTHLSGQAHELGRAPASVVGPDFRLHDDGAGSAPGRARASRGARATARAALTQQSRFFHPPRGRAQRSRVRSRGGERARGGRGGHRGRGSPRESPERRANAEAGIDPSRRTVARARRVKRLRLGTRRRQRRETRHFVAATFGPRPTQSSEEVFVSGFRQPSEKRADRASADAGRGPGQNFARAAEPTPWPTNSRYAERAFTTRASRVSPSRVSPPRRSTKRGHLRSLFLSPPRGSRNGARSSSLPRGRSLLREREPRSPRGRAQRASPRRARACHGAPTRQTRATID